VVATVMSNLGLEKALEREGIRMTRTPVGDKYVLEEMVRLGAALGGEQSGHLIFREYATTGDGLLTAAHLLAAVRQCGSTLEEAADLERFPQVLLNVRVGTRRPVAEVPALAAAVRSAEDRLSDNGRVFVRYSGTEPLLRIMVEAEEDSLARETAEGIAAVARQQLGPA
jgi:phosphoglucosamine mutase